MSLTVQLYTMLSMVGMGAWVGAALDTYHRFLQRSKRKRWLVFIHDLVFWAVQALLVFYVLLLVNEAELRLYVFPALLCGFAAYQSLFKSLYTSILEAVIQAVIRTYRFVELLVKALIIKPILYILQLLLATGLFLVHVMRRVLLLLLKLTIWLVFFIWKIIWVPIRLIGLLLWKLLPKSSKNFIRRYAGILKKIEKMKVMALKWWEQIKQWLGGPRA